MTRHRRSLISLAAVGFLVATATSCGSRTGLLVGSTLADGGVLPDGAVIPDPIAPEPVTCTPGRFDLEAAATRLMFVLDRSGSMSSSLAGLDPPPPGEGSRWQVLKNGLAEAILPFDQEIAMGAKFFPEETAELSSTTPSLACITDNGVGLAPRRGNAASILSVFDSTGPRGATPTSEALRIAASYLLQNRAVARSIILATDGAPNCNSAADTTTCVCAAPQGTCSQYAELCLDDVRTVATVQQIAAQGVPVYVIGLGSTERPEFLRVLDEMAVAGGRPRPTVPRHYNVQTPDELRSGLASIRDSAASCTYLTPSSPTDANAITIEIGGTVVPRDESHRSGWDWADRVYGVITLYGTACERAASKPVAANVRCTP